MRMPRWMCGKTKDRVNDEYIGGNVGVAPIEDKRIKNQFRWYGHMQRKDEGLVEARICVEKAKQRTEDLSNMERKLWKKRWKLAMTMEVAYNSMTCE